MVGSVRKSIFSYEAKDFSSYFVDETNFAYPDDIYGFINNAPTFTPDLEPPEDSQACQCKTPCRPYGRCYRFQHLCFKIVRISFRVLLFMFIFALIFIDGQIHSTTVYHKPIHFIYNVASRRCNTLR
ncbi:uncharacterized protein LOC106872774 isoform X3 [Octopus bimaculoides]|uniref:uncharacterized protein LOC106872774 isoform X3 n=1 Tax=Octopus bimaculoides TaxID=37653 RepID=UPI0022E2A401|nr:uncharacterized protein LOC106872774 isoform X3 [Octopus bimaculoides]